jgi:addiction module RelE/StbE family toxin
MKNYPLRWLDRAQSDLKEIRRYIATEERAPVAAEKVVRGLRKSVANLRQFPESGTLIEEGRWHGCREIYPLNFRVIYRFDGMRVMIVTVVRGKRRLD